MSSYGAMGTRMPDHSLLASKGIESPGASHYRAIKRRFVSPWLKPPTLPGSQQTIRQPKVVHEYIVM